MIVYLNYTEALKIGAIVNRELYLQKYDKPRGKMSLLEGAEPLINIEGHYVISSKIIDLAPYSIKNTLAGYVYALRRPIVGYNENITFRWK